MARTLGEPFDLRRADTRCHRCVVRFPRQHDWAAGTPPRKVLLLDPAKARAAIEAPYDMAAIMLILTAFIVGVFYCLDALYGERRDRSILFWEVVAGIRSHHIALEGHNSAGRSTVGNVRCYCRGDTVGHAAFWHASALLITHAMSPASTWT